MLLNPPCLVNFSAESVTILTNKRGCFYNPKEKCNNFVSLCIIISKNKHYETSPLAYEFQNLLYCMNMILHSKAILPQHGTFFIHMGFAYLQWCGRSTYKQTEGLSDQGCRRGQGHEEQVATCFWRLFSHPVHYTTVHDGTNHLEQKEFLR